jgi:hypothetical protein
MLPGSPARHKGQRLSIRGQVASNLPSRLARTSCERVFSGLFGLFWRETGSKLPCRCLLRGREGNIRGKLARGREGKLPSQEGKLPSAMALARVAVKGSRGCRTRSRFKLAGAALAEMSAPCSSALVTIRSNRPLEAPCSLFAVALFALSDRAVLQGAGSLVGQHNSGYVHQSWSACSSKTDLQRDSLAAAVATPGRVLPQGSRAELGPVL